MRRLLPFLLTWAVLAPPPANAAIHLIFHRVPSGACADDGHVGAPSGTPLYGGLRATWASPPECQVPDVDYPVGPDATHTLQSPATATLPGTASYDAANHRIRCDGDTGDVFTDLDFSLVGGGGFYFYNCHNVTLRNVKITWNCASGPINQAANSTGITIDKVWVDGGSTNGGLNCPENDGEVVILQGAGAKSIQYMRITNSPQHNLSINCTGVCTDIVKWVSLSRTGFDSGAHDNGLEWGGSFTSTQVQDVLFYNPQPDTPQNGVFISTVAGSPTVRVWGNAGCTVPLGHQTSYVGGMQATSAAFSGTQTIASSDPVANTVTFGTNATSTGCPTMNVLNAFPIGITIPVRYVSEDDQFGMGGQSLTNAVFKRLTIAGVGPVMGNVAAIYCTHDVDTTTDGVIVTDSAVDLRGSTSFANGNNNCTNASGARNKALNTGAPVTFP